MFTPVIKIQKIIQWCRKANLKIYLITDSDVAEYWSSGQQNIKEEYVTKSAKKIVQMLPPSIIFHIGTSDNPADSGTRTFGSPNKSTPANNFVNMINFISLTLTFH